MSLATLSCIANVGKTWTMRNEENDILHEFFIVVEIHLVKKMEICSVNFHFHIVENLYWLQI